MAVSVYVEHLRRKANLCPRAAGSSFGVHRRHLSVVTAAYRRQRSIRPSRSAPCSAVTNSSLPVKASSQWSDHSGMDRTQRRRSHLNWGSSPWCRSARKGGPKADSRDSPQWGQDRRYNPSGNSRPTAVIDGSEIVASKPTFADCDRLRRKPRQHNEARSRVPLIHARIAFLE